MDWRVQSYICLELSHVDVPVLKENPFFAHEYMNPIVCCAGKADGPVVWWWCSLASARSTAAWSPLTCSSPACSSRPTPSCVLLLHVEE